MARNLTRTTPAAADVPAANVPPLQTPPPAMGGNLSIAESDAAIAGLIAAEREADKLKGDSRDKSNAALSAASCALMLAVGQRFQIDPAFTPEAIMVRYEGKAVVDKWRDSTKDARTSEWRAIERAAKQAPQRFNADLWAIAKGKDKFRTLCRAVADNPVIEKAALETLATAKPTFTTGDHIASALLALGKIDMEHFPHVREAVAYLQEVKREQNFLTTSEAAKAAKPGTTTAKDGGKMSLQDKMNLSATKPTMQ